MALKDKAEVVEMLTEAYMGTNNLVYLGTDNLTREDLKARKEEVGEIMSIISQMNQRES